MKRLLSLVIIVFVLVSVIHAQQENTPTPAPSKTPMTTADSAEQTAEPTSEFVGRELPRSYTQEDLSVLVANVQRPNGFVWLNNNLYTACAGDWTLYEINSESGSTVSYVFGIQNAHTLYGENTDAGFNLFIPDFDTNRLMLVDHTASSPQPVATTDLDGPWGIAALTDEQFLISNVRGNNLVYVDREGDTSVAVEGLRSPAGLVIDDDMGYVVNNGSARRAIEWFDTADLDAEEAVNDITQPLVSGLQNASGLALGADEYLYIAYALGTRGVVGRVQPDECRENGGCTNEDVEIVVFTELQAPLAGLTVSPDMRIFMHTIFRPEIYWVSLYD